MTKFVKIICTTMFTVLTRMGQEYINIKNK